MIFLKSHQKKDKAFDFIKPILLTSVWKRNVQLHVAKMKMDISDMLQKLKNG